MGMATFDDFDGVWFTVQAIAMYHPEVAADLWFVILDNHRRERRPPISRAWTRRVPGLRYVPFRGYSLDCGPGPDLPGGGRRRGVCLDSHVLVKPGGLAAVLD